MVVAIREVGKRTDRPGRLQSVLQDVSCLGLATCNRDAAWGMLCWATSKVGSVPTFAARSSGGWPWQGYLGGAADLEKMAILCSTH